MAPGSFEVDHTESGRKNNQDYFLAPPFWGEAYIRSPFFAPIFLFAQTEVRFREERDSIYDTCANGVLGSVKMRFWASGKPEVMSQIGPSGDYFRLAVTRQLAMRAVRMDDLAGAHQSRPLCDF